MTYEETLDEPNLRDYRALPANTVGKRDLSRVRAELPEIENEIVHRSPREHGAVQVGR